MVNTHSFTAKLFEHDNYLKVMPQKLFCKNCHFHIGNKTCLQVQLEKIEKLKERYLILTPVNDPNIFFTTSHLIGSKITMSPLFKY